MVLLLRASLAALMALKCCSKARMAKKKAAFDKATKAANSPLGPDGRFSAKAPKKKASGKKAANKPAKPCRACGK